MSVERVSAGADMLTVLTGVHRLIRLEASDLTLLKIFIFHSSIDGPAKRASTLFLKNGIMLYSMSQALFALP